MTAPSNGVLVVTFAVIGLAVLTAPLALCALADRVGVARAVSLEFALIAVSLLLLFAGAG